MALSSRWDTQPYYELAVFDPASTGLDTRIYVAVCGHAKIGPRLKVVTQDGKRLSVSLSATPDILAAPDRYIFSTASWQKVVQYIQLNLEVLLAYWHEAIDTHALVQQLRRLETPAQDAADREEAQRG